MSSDSDHDQAALLAWIDGVDDYWARAGMARTTRRRLRAELERDVSDALAGGASVTSLTAENAADFAKQVASANGIELKELRTPPKVTNRSIVGTGLIGGAIGAVVAWELVYPHVRLPGIDGASELVVAMSMHVTAAAVVLIFCLAAIRWRFRDDKSISRTLAFAGPLMVLAGAASVAPTMTFARFANYSFDPFVLLTEVAIVGAFIAAAIVLARRLATHPRPHLGRTNTT